MTLPGLPDVLAANTVFDAVFATASIEVLKTAVRAPRANAYAERWVGTVRWELLDRMLIIGRRHLELVVDEYVDHYNGHRPNALWDRPRRSNRRSHPSPWPASGWCAAIVSAA